MHQSTPRGHARGAPKGDRLEPLGSLQARHACSANTLEKSRGVPKGNRLENKKRPDARLSENRRCYGNTVALR